MFKLVILIILLSACAKDLELNPYTTILKHIMKESN